MNIKIPLAVAVILLFFIVSVIPSTGITDVKRNTMPTTSGNILYVGGNGTGNYSFIQWAINDASDGDTVFVYDDSSPYLEKIQIDKSIQLIGEQRDTTVIDSVVFNYEPISISADNVDVKGFTIFGSIEIESNNTSIFNNNISCLSDNDCIIIKSPISDNYPLTNNTIIGNTLISSNFSSRSCIIVWYSHYSLIADNVIYSRGTGGYTGIFLVSNHSIIYGNNIKEFYYGVLLVGINSSVYGNTVSKCNFSFYIGSEHNYECGFNKIYLNTIKSSNCGITIGGSIKNEIFENNFFDNSQDAFFIDFFIGSSNQWRGNYWERSRLLPKLIFGWKTIYSIFLPWINIDWNPASEPYDIEV